jgi:hypothetical protein
MVGGVDYQPYLPIVITVVRTVTACHMLFELVRRLDYRWNKHTCGCEDVCGGISNQTRDRTALSSSKISALNVISTSSAANFPFRQRQHHS